MARKYVLKVEEIEHSLQELDETVASLGDVGDNVFNLSPSRRRHDDTPEECEVLRHGTQFPLEDASEAIWMQRHLIDNIETIKGKQGLHKRTSTCSRKSVTTKGSRYSRSISSRSSRNRGFSLERTICEIVANTANQDEFRAINSVQDDEASSISTNDILNDLIQADTVWNAEVGTIPNLLPAIETEDESDLLPPVDGSPVDASHIAASPFAPEPEWQEDIQAFFSERKLSPQSRQNSLVPTLEASPRLSRLEKSSCTVDTCPETVNISGESVHKSAKPDFDTRSNMLSEDLFVSLQSHFPTLEKFDSKDNDWMSFEWNPFNQDDNLSLDSPSSIVNFSRVVDRVPSSKSKSWFVAATTKGSF